MSNFNEHSLEMAIMELDFLIRYKGECVPVEVKAKTAQAKSISTVRKHPEKYGVKLSLSLVTIT